LFPSAGGSTFSSALNLGHITEVTWAAICRASLALPGSARSHQMRTLPETAVTEAHFLVLMAHGLNAFAAAGAAGWAIADELAPAAEVTSLRYRAT
jgi:hypothetical protein